MAKSKGLGIPETRGRFQVKGVVVGTGKRDFFTDKMTSTNKPFRAVNFGVRFDSDKTLYVGFNGMEQEKVYFYKSELDEKTGKRSTDTQAVDWKDRYRFDKEGYRLIGINLGIQKTVDDQGKEINDKVVLAPYDACAEIADKLCDGVSVYVRGNISYSTYKGKHQTRFEPGQISLAQDVEFDAEGYEYVADFEQTLIFMGISPNEDKTKFIVAAKIVTYNSVKDAEYIVIDPQLAAYMKKNIKPYSALKAWGNINIEQHTVDSEDTGIVGSPNKMVRVSAPTSRELILTGLDPTTIDREVYAQDVLEEAIAATKMAQDATIDYGDGDNKVGSTNTFADSVDDDADSPWD